ncbi:MAG: hypothetical protein AAF587_29570 [Bacteroidota bacterium]
MSLLNDIKNSGKNTTDKPVEEQYLELYPDDRVNVMAHVLNNPDPDRFSQDLHKAIDQGKRLVFEDAEEDIDQLPPYRIK